MAVTLEVRRVSIGVLGCSMCHSLRLMVVAFAMLVTPQIVSAEARMYFVPQGEDPTDIPGGPTVPQLKPGGSIVLEVFIDGVAPELLRGAQFFVSGPVLGTGGSITAVASQSNFLRPDYVLRPSRVSCGMNLGFGASFACKTEEPVLATESGYFAELRFEVSYDACGSFIIQFGAPGADASAETFMLNPDVARIPFTADPAIIQVERYGDANYNGHVDVFDIMCVLDGFRGIFEYCPMENVDIAGCEADGRVDLFDILAVLDAFAGVNPCPEWCGTPVWP